jgi:hypothetical protein
MISTRFAPIVIVLLGLALVPTVLHSYLGVKTQDGLTTKQIETTLAGIPFAPTQRRATWGKSVFDSDDWIERRSQAANGENLLLFVARSYDHKRLYHHPELAVLYGRDLVNAGTTRLTSRPDRPLHVLRARIGTGVAAYALLHDGQFVENPILFQLQTSWRSLFSAARLMTLFLIYDSQLPQDSALEGTQAARVLNEAIQQFQRGLKT